MENPFHCNRCIAPMEAFVDLWYCDGCGKVAWKSLMTGPDTQISSKHVVLGPDFQEHPALASKIACPYCGCPVITRRARQT